MLCSFIWKHCFLPTLSFLQQPLAQKSRQIASVPSNPRLSQWLNRSEKYWASSSSRLSVGLLWNRAGISLSPYLESSQLSTRQTNSCMLVLWSSKMSDPLPAGQRPTSIFFLNPLRNYTLIVFISAFYLETTSSWNWLLVSIFLTDLGRGMSCSLPDTNTCRFSLIPLFNEYVSVKGMEDGFLRL